MKERLRYVVSMSVLFFAGVIVQFVVAAPSISSKSPAANALNITASSNIAITFSEAMNSATLTASTITVNGSQRGKYSGTISYNSSTNTATFDPDSLFKVGELITVVVTTGAQNSGNVGLATGNSWSFTAASDQGEILTAATNYTTGDSPTGVNAVDIDGDGDIDLVTSNQNSNDISVLLNTGYGSFAAKVDYSTGQVPWDIATADVDGDGDIDVITANQSAGTLSVIKNNGNGTFATHVDYGVHGNPPIVTTADVDGDGDVDLISTGQGSFVSVLKNNGDGTFASKVDYATGLVSYGVTTADVDGDGDMDLIVTNSSSSAASVLKNNGDGTFAAKIDYTTGTGPYDLASADIDGDGDMDILTANGSSNDLSVLKNNGDGTFAAKTDYTVGSTPFNVTTLDMDGDGDLDLMTSNAASNSLSLLKNNGDGTFAAKQDFPVGNNLYDATAADVDGDGNVDLISSNANTDNVSVLLNVIPTTITATVPAVNALNISASSNITITFNREMNSGTLSASNIKVNGSHRGRYSGAISYNSGTHTATFNPDSTFFPGEIVTVTITTGVQNSVGGALDTAKNWSFTVEAVTSGGTFAAKVDYGAGLNPRSVVSTDVDGDGDIDLAAVNFSGNNLSVFKNNGDGSYAAKVDYATGTEPRLVSSVDVDGDSDMDLVTANYISHTLSVLKNNGDGTFAAKVDYGTGFNPQSVTAADVDGDGDMDLVAANFSSNTLSVFKNNGDGTYAAKVDYGTGTYPQSVTSTDVDGDGDMDLVAANSTANTLSVLKNNGDGTFVAKVDYATGTAPYSVTSADVDGDGDIDLVAANNDANTLSVLKNNGDGTFVAKVDYATGTAPYSVTFADVDGDGDMDLAAVNYSSNTLSVFKNNGDGTYAAKVDYGTGSGPISVTSADGDGDGGMDLVAANQVSNTLSVFKNFTPLLITSISPSANALDITTSSNITIIFSVDMNSATMIADSTINVSGSLSGIHTGAISYNSGTKTATFNPNTDFLPGEVVTVTATTGIKDGSGAALQTATTWQFTIESIVAAGTFETTQSVSSLAEDLITLAAGDVDTDGDIDLVVRPSGKDSIKVLLRNSNGTYAEPVAYAAGSNPTGVALGDMDGDGVLDILVSNGDGNSVSVFINNGSGAFAAKTDYAVLTKPISVEIGDLDGDGFQDVVVSSTFFGGVDSIMVLMNNGNGTLASGVRYLVGGSTVNVALTDADNDGDLDVAVNCLANSVVSFLKNNGDGTLASKTDYTTDSYPIGLTAGDLNGDGYSDLVTANLNDNVSVLLGNGDGTFATKVTYSTGSNTSAASIDVLTADIDGDGDLDIVSSNNAKDSISILFNNGNGTFGTDSSYAASTAPYAMVAADFNGNGDIDIMTANSNASSPLNLLLNGGALLAVTSQSPAKNAVNVAGTANATLTFNNYIESSSLADSTFVLQGSRTGIHTGTVTYDNGTRTATFDPSSDFLAGELVTISATPKIKTTTSDSLTNGYSSQFVVAAASSDTFETQINRTVGSSPVQSLSIDIDQDGDLDIVTALYGADSISVIKNNGNGIFAAKVTYATAANPWSVATGDVDLDGDIDLVATDFGAAKVSVLLNNGNGTFASKTDYTVGNGPTYSTVADVNGDGFMDIASTNYNSNTISVLLNNGDGTFASKTDYATGTNPYNVVAADIDRDGDLDLAAANNNGSSVSTLKNTGSGTFAAKVDFTTGTNPNSVAAGDLDGDGDADLVVGNNTSNTLSVFLNSGDTTFSAKVDYATGTNPNGLVLADMNGDGALDIINGNYSDSTFTTLLNNGSGTFGSRENYSVGTNVREVDAADVDNDGDIDIVATNFTANTVSVFRAYTIVEPTTAASNVTFSAVGASGFTVNWTNGNGSDRLVVIKQGSAVDAMPADGATYTSNAIFASGSQIGTGNYVVYNGSGSSAAVTGLSATTTYHVAVFEYNGVNGTENYLVTSAPVSDVTTTAAIVTFSDGSLDPDYGIGGKVTTPYGVSNAAHAIALQSDDHAVIVGEVNMNFAALRYDTNGNLDPGFSSDGKDTTNFGSVLSPQFASDIAIQPNDGKIVMAGEYNYDVALVRYQSNGTRDAGFGTDGKVTTDLNGGGMDAGNAVALQSDGKILVAGSFSGGMGSGDFALIRYTTTGSVDSTFGTDGIVITDFGGFEAAYGMAIQPDGKIILVGDAGPGFAVARYDTGGTLDATFSGDGKIVTEFGGFMDYASSVAVTSTGEIVVTGYATDNGDVGIACYDANGNLYTGFNGTGTVTTDFGSDDVANAIGIQSDGKIVITGSSNSQILVARYTAAGALDNTFNITGSTLIPFGSYASGSDLAFQSDNKIVISVNTDGDFGAIRLGGDDGTALPVELASFTVTPKRLTAELQWTTATENNSYGFEIERCVAGSHTAHGTQRQWVNVGFVEGSGTTNTQNQYLFTDRNLTAAKYQYRLKQIDHDGKFAYSKEVEVNVGAVPLVFALEQNYPNPFNPSTTIGFTLEQSGLTTLKIYDIVGREVATLVHEVLEAGTYHQKQFNARNLASGVYYARLISGGKVQVKKLMLMK